MSHLESAGEDLSGRDEVSTPVREGLPATYRMRADSHYVDLLTARPSAGREPVSPPRGAETASLSEVATRADGELERTLGSLTACTDFLSRSDSDLSRTIADTLLRAELWRASCLLNATRVLRQELPAVRIPLPVRRVLDQLVNGFAPERRLRMIEFDVKSSLPSDAVMITDERFVLVVLSSAVRAVLSLFNEVAGATVRVGAGAEAGDTMTFTISQNTVAVADAWIARAFDRTWVDRPGGLPTLTSMLALKQAAETLGGHVSIAAVGLGTAITISIPAGI